MPKIAFVFRADNTNVGDWFSPPVKYFPLQPGPVFDLLDTDVDYNNFDVIIMGGGGLGTEYFKPHLDRLAGKPRNYKVAAWGVGVDNINEKGRLLEEGHSYDLYGDWFNQFDEVGIRVHSADQKFDYVPCASCMNPLFFKYRDKKPTKAIGVYHHKRVRIFPQRNPMFEESDNDGNDLEAKLAFMSDHEYILTNTYHGVYWATLLNRKVICVPFKSGLFSFKHRPVYTQSTFNNDHLHAARNYPEALEDARRCNVDYYIKLANKLNIA